MEDSCTLTRLELGSVPSEEGGRLSEHEHRTEEEVLEEQGETVEDLDVPEGQQEDVAGGLVRKDLK
jgi:hypothetical protein